MIIAFGVGVLVVFFVNFFHPEEVEKVIPFVDSECAWFLARAGDLDHIRVGACAGQQVSGASCVRERLKECVLHDMFYSEIVEAAQKMKFISVLLNTEFVRSKDVGYPNLPLVYSGVLDNAFLGFRIEETSARKMRCFFTVEQKTNERKEEYVYVSSVIHVFYVDIACRCEVERYIDDSEEICEYKRILLVDVVIEI